MSESSMVQFKLNMPAKLRERLGEAANRSGRSLTSEVLARLEKSFADDEDWQNALDNISDALLRIEQLERQVSALQYSAGARDFPENEA